MDNTLRKAAEMALHALKFSQNMKRCFARAEQDYHEKIAPIAIEALRTALAQPEQEKGSTLRDADPRLLLGRSNNFTKETENRLCDIERRLAVIETQPAQPSKSWVSLTDEEIENISNQIERSDFFDCVIPFARAIEAALRKENDPTSN